MDKHLQSFALDELLMSIVVAQSCGLAGKNPKQPARLQHAMDACKPNLRATTVDIDTVVICVGRTSFIWHA